MIGHRVLIFFRARRKFGSLENRAQKPSLSSSLFLALIAIVITLAALETGIRTIDVMRGEGFFSGPRNVVARTLDSRIPFRGFGFNPYAEIDGTKYISSRHGELYPFEKPHGTFRIVSFGGSTTENGTAKREAGIHYPLQLQSELRKRLGRPDIEVINLGNSAYATPHSLIFLELDVLSWNPDLVILSHNANDLGATYYPGFTPDYSNKYGDPYYFGGFTTADAIFQHFQLYWSLKTRLGRVLNRDAYAYRTKSYGDEVNPEGAAVFIRILRSFVTMAESNGISVLLATQAYDANKPPRNFEKPSIKKIIYPLPEEMAKHHAYYNRLIETVAAENGAWFVDNAGSMKYSLRLFIDPLHYTEQGVRELDQNYADFLIANDIAR